MYALYAQMLYIYVYLHIFIHNMLLNMWSTGLWLFFLIHAMYVVWHMCSLNIYIEYVRVRGSEVVAGSG